MLKQRERRPLAAFPTPRLSSALPRTTWTCGFGLLCSIPDFCVLSFNIAASPLSTNSMIRFCSVHCLLSAMEKGQGFPMSCEVSYLGNTAWPIFVPLMFNLGFHFCTCVRDRWCPWLRSQMPEWIEICAMFFKRNCVCVCARAHARMLSVWPSTYVEIRG